jgi:hypothetical protein
MWNRVEHRFRSLDGTVTFGDPVESRLGVGSLVGSYHEMQSSILASSSVNNNNNGASIC